MKPAVAVKKMAKEMRQHLRSLPLEKRERVRHNISRMAASEDSRKRGTR